MGVHPTALIAPTAELGEDVQVGAYCIIKDNVKIGRQSVIESHTVIEHTTIGQNCYIAPYCSIGLPPQDLNYKNEATSVQIGDRVQIREFCTIHRGTPEGAGRTIVQDDCLLMTYSHVGHDCHLEPGVLLINNATLGGHVLVQRKAQVGAFFLAHQRIQIGELAMCVAMSRTQRSIPPYVLVDGGSARILKVNIIGLQRDGFSKEELDRVKWAYDLLKRKPNQEALAIIEQESINCPRLTRIVEFYRNSAVPVASFLSVSKTRSAHP